MPVLSGLTDMGLIQRVLHPSLSFALFLFAFLASAYVFYQRHLHPLSGIPGPFWASLSRLWLIRITRSGYAPDIMIALHRRHGHLVRIGPNEVSVSDATALRTIYGAGSKFRKSNWYSVWQGHRKFDLFGERDEKIHAAQRKLVNRAYAMDMMKDLEPYVDSTINMLLDCLDAPAGQVIDLGLWVHLFAFDVIGEITFSRSFSFLTTGQDDGSLHAIKTAGDSGSWVGQLPLLWTLNDRLTPLIGNHLAMNNRHGSLRTLAAKEVSSRLDGGTDRTDMLSKLAAVHTSNPEHFDAAALTSMATTNIFAGSDTTAGTLRATLDLLLRHPAVLQRFRDELVSSGLTPGAIPSFAQASAMPYLNAVLHESLRLRPVIGLGLPRVVPKGGCMVSATPLPAGTTISAWPWVVHRDAAVFGPDADAFRPERWLDPEAAAAMHRCSIGFGMGARLCIGKNVSWLEMLKVLPALVAAYDMHLVHPGRETGKHASFFVAWDALQCTVTPRKRGGD